MVSSADGVYRYLLRRTWDEPNARASLAFVLLCPGPKELDNTDPVIERCQERAYAAGYGSVTVASVFAMRVGNLRRLARAEWPGGPGNDEYLEDLSPGPVVCAWGSGCPTKHRPVLLRAVECLERLGAPLYCLGTTKNGDPKSPRYVNAKVGLERWKGYV